MSKRFTSAILVWACLGCTAITYGQRTPALPPLDPQKVQDQDDMSWNDYHPNPGGVDWADTAAHPPVQRTIKVAVVAADFDDQPFVITLPKKSDLYGNPQIDPIKREDVAKFYANFWNGRDPMHNKHTVNEYWMEQSHGKIGVELTPFGPFHMAKKSFQYGLQGFGQNNSAPTGFPAEGNMQGELDTMWRAADGANVREPFQLVLRIYAGYDETSVWQEFGEMKFQTKEDITPEWGNPDPTKPRWAPTRYTPWTTWKSATWLWSNSSIIQGECSGSIVHEISHAAFRIGDNNNNPYVTPYRRVGSGPWDIMDRGSFNGPGGPHDRWQIPVVKGAAMPAGLMLRQKIQFGFVDPAANVVQLSREGLAKSGLAVATVMSRTADPGPTGISGMLIRLDGDAVPIPAAALSSGRGRGAVIAPAEGEPVAPGAMATAPATAAATADAAGGGARGGRGAGRGGGGGGGRGGALATTTQDRTPWEDPATHPLSEGIPNFNFYTMEVVQRVGYDSFCPDSGVLIAKNKDQASSNGGPNAYGVFNWVIDAHPEDMNKLDFKRPNGEQVMRTPADYRQLNDALFHAGTGGGAVNEWEDTPNRLHFYVLDTKKDEKGVLWYTMGVRSLDGSGPQKRDVSLAAPGAPTAVREANTKCEFTLKNTGEAAEVDAALHGQQKDVQPYLSSDIYRLSVSVSGNGWTAQLQNPLVAVKFRDVAKVPVFVSHGAGGAGTATVTLKAVSESDPTKSATVSYNVTAQ